MEISFKPIGFVSSEYKDPGDVVFACEKGLRTKSISRIIMDEKFQAGLKGLEEFSHVFVIYFLDGVRRTELVTHPGPPSVKSLPKVGVFASRSQHRPNPIALRLVKILKVDKNEITVQGLDAVNGSPILDIKPYILGFDRPENSKQASWYEWL